MAIYNKSAEPAPVAARLNLLEEKVRNIAPGEGADLTALTEALNRLYDMTMRGGTHTPGDVTADQDDGDFWFRLQPPSSTEPKSILTVTYGDADYLDQVKDRPFWHQVIGTSTSWNFVAPPGGNQDEYSLAGTVFSTPANLVDIRARGQTILGLMFNTGAGTDWRDFIDAHGSILRAMYGPFGFDGDPEASTKSLLSIIRELEARIVDLEGRVEWLENH
jgi:hypothetical protein